MNPFHHPQCNDVLKRPAGTTEEECGDLHIVREDGKVMSFWKPEPIELEALNQGGSVGLIVMGTTHPPLAVVTITPTDEDQRPVQTTSKILDLFKRALSSWARNAPGDKDRENITDEFLDLTKGQHVKEKPTDAELWKADAQGWKAAATHVKNALAEAQSSLATERELRQAAEANIDNLFHYLEGREGHVPVSGRAVVIRDWMISTRTKLSEVRVKLETIMRPNLNHSEE